MKEISAGAVLYTRKQDEVLYLLIRDFHGNYGFPKGHLEKGETLKEAAEREIREEVGLDIEADTDFREDLNYIMPNGIEKQAVYFIGEFSDQDYRKQEEEVDEILLFPYEEAYRTITFDNMREVLSKADRYIREDQHE
ncbi:MAG: NUDIX domain-containing protein [Erysipelotrichaceae bacterium]|nr:NUDIX domain-containing protein [Erysipelotrichaceae bacterium]